MVATSASRPRRLRRRARRRPRRCPRRRPARSFSLRAEHPPTRSGVKEYSLIVERMAVGNWQTIGRRGGAWLPTPVGEVVAGDHPALFGRRGDGRRALPGLWWGQWVTGYHWASPRRGSDRPERLASPDGRRSASAEGAVVRWLPTDPLSGGRVRAPRRPWPCARSRRMVRYVEQPGGFEVAGVSCDLVPVQPSAAAISFARSGSARRLVHRGEQPDAGVVESVASPYLIRTGGRWRRCPSGMAPGGSRQLALGSTSTRSPTPYPAARWSVASYAARRRFGPERPPGGTGHSMACASPARHGRRRLPRRTRPARPRRRSPCATCQPARNAGRAQASGDRASQSFSPSTT